MRTRWGWLAPAAWLALAPLAGCEGDPDGEGTDSEEQPATPGNTDPGALPQIYAFDSRFDDGSSVSYTGQVFRQLLIDDMGVYLADLTGRIDAGETYPVAGDVQADLDFYLEFDSDSSGSVPHLQSTTPAALQATYADVSSGKDLVEKIAGNDATGQHKDWSTDFVGWPQAGVTTPESLIRVWIAQIDAQAADWTSGDIPLAPDGQPVPSVYVTPDGLDLRQLVLKLTRGAIAFSQGADDYLDDDEPDKGLRSDNVVAVSGKNYTGLEHAWDEGFGYFGAARNYPAWTDDDIADLGYRDDSGDGAVDLRSEVNWGHSVNAAKRDRGSAAEAATDYTAQAWEGFARGRRLIANSSGALSDAEMDELVAYRDQAVAAWENAIAATVVHYINDVLQDMSTIDTGDYDFGDHAKHWAEMKGFALSLQFNPSSPLDDADFADFHDLVGTAPVLADADSADRDAYAQALIDARAILGTAYGFDAANLGDDAGENGW